MQTAEGAICGSRSALTNVSIPWQRVHGNPRWAVKIVDREGEGVGPPARHMTLIRRPACYVFARIDERIARGKPGPRLSRRRVEKWGNYAPGFKRHRHRSIPDWPGGLLERS